MPQIAEEMCKAIRGPSQACFKLRTDYVCVYGKATFRESGGKTVFRNQGQICAALTHPMQPHDAPGGSFAGVLIEV
jgi:hypothetical protein